MKPKHRRQRVARSDPRADLEAAFLSPRAWRVVWVLTGVACGALFGGFALDAKAFAVNLLAGVVGLLLGAALATWGVEWLIKRQRDREFLGVARRTEEAIAMVIEEIASYYRLALGPDEQIERAFAEAAEAAEVDESTRPNAELANAMSQTAQWILARKHELSKPTLPSEVSSSRALYEEVRPLFERLWFQLAPRVMALSGDAAVMNGLIHLEEREISWRTAILHAERGGADGFEAWEFAAEVLVRAAEAYRAMLPRFEWDFGTLTEIDRASK